MKTCELCKRLARTHCESDRASLCWSCDYKVHSANFLVARHSRTLLCQICQTPTPWAATGLKLGPAVSVCVTCARNHNKISHNEETEARNEDEEMEPTDSFDEEDDEDLEYDSGEETDCEDNQVVPWSPSTPPPTSTANSSSDEESSSSSSLSSPRILREVIRKRTREDTDRCYNVNYVSGPSQENVDAPPPMETVEVLEAAAAAAEDGSSPADVGTVDSSDSLSTMAENSLKKSRIQTDQSEISESRAWVMAESIRKLQQGTVSSEAIVQLRRLSAEDPSAVDYDSSDST